MNPWRALHCGDDLSPDGEHSQKQADRRQCSGFFNDGAKHDVLPERKENIVHGPFYCQATIGNFLRKPKTGVFSMYCTEDALVPAVLAAAKLLLSTPASTRLLDPAACAPLAVSWGRASAITFDRDKV